MQLLETDVLLVARTRSPAPASLANPVSLVRHANPKQRSATTAMVTTWLATARKPQAPTTPVRHATRLRLAKQVTLPLDDLPEASSATTGKETR